MTFIVRSVWTLSISIFISCNPNDQSQTLLQQTPYQNITDSIKQFPDKAELYYKRGILLLQNKQLPLAEQDMKKAWNLAKEERYALSTINVLNQKHIDTAIHFAETASRQLPQSISLQVNLAQLYQQKEDHQKALAICNQIISHYPNQIDALLLKAQILQSTNQHADALATLEKAYTYAPFDVELSYQLAFTYADSKNAKALSLSDSLIRMDTSKSHAEPYYFKGVYYENIGNAARAIHYYDEATRHDYNFLDAYMSKGEILFDQKKLAEAVKTFQLVIQISPTYADAWFWLGKCEQALGNKQEARLNYQRAYGLDKSLMEAKQAAEQL